MSEVSVHEEGVRTQPFAENADDLSWREATGRGELTGVAALLTQPNAVAKRPETSGPIWTAVSAKSNEAAYPTGVEGERVKDWMSQRMPQAAWLACIVMPYFPHRTFLHSDQGYTYEPPIAQWQWHGKVIWEDTAERQRQRKAALFPRD